MVLFLIQAPEGFVLSKIHKPALDDRFVRGHISSFVLGHLIILLLLSRRCVVLVRGLHGLLRGAHVEALGRDGLEGSRVGIAVPVDGCLH